MRKKLIAGNWKMNLNTHQASLYLHKLDKIIESVHRDVEVAFFPNFLVLQSLSLQVNHRKFKLGAQNCYYRDEGAFTGEVSATMLRGLVKYVLVGHSERRHIFGERDADLKLKVQAAIRNNIQPILCVGETAQEKADGETNHVLHGQVVAGLANVTSDEIEDIVIAYEPVWAISNGKDFTNHKIATPDDVVKAVRTIRHQIESLYGKKAAEAVRVLYGGSSNAGNASAFLAVPGVDGLLVGGASLNAHEFASMVTSAHEQAQKDSN
jgi:triosephosphate isomerase